MSAQYPYSPELRTDIQGRLSRHPLRRRKDSVLKKAAVALVLVTNDSNETCFVLTQRPTTLKRHGGQYALPGGRLEPDESVTEAALRETREEIGIDLPMSAVLGQLDDFETRSGYCITPIVAWAEGITSFDPDPAEVYKLLLIPLWDLARPEIPDFMDSDDSEHPIVCTKLATLGHRVFAPTAAILYQFREVALFNRSTRVFQFDQPKFARK